MKFEIYRKDRSGPRLGLTVSIIGRGEIDLPYLSDDAFEKLTLPVNKHQLTAFLDHEGKPPPDLARQIIAKTAWWLQVQTEVLYAQWPRDTLALLRAAYELFRDKNLGA